MMTARLHAVSASGSDGCEITFELPDGRTRTFACRFVAAGATPVWEPRFHELVDGRDPNLKHELSCLVAFFHLVRQTEWNCPSRSAAQAGPAT